jgi:zinc protease
MKNIYKVPISVSIALIAHMLMGQDKNTSMKAVRRLHRAPVNKEVLSVHLPRPVEMKLPNGLTLLVLEQHKLPTIQASLWIKTGALSDTRDIPGLANLTAEMLREGTAKRDSDQISRELDAIGGELDSEARFGQGITRVNASGLVDSADSLIDLMSDVVISPGFPETELEKYKKRRQAQLEQQRTEPGFLTREKFYRVMYGDSPASMVAPTSASVAAVTAVEMRKYHDAYYVPGNAILAILGDVSAQEARELVERHFGSWQNHAAPPLRLPEVPPPNTKRIYLIDRPGSVQTNILIGDFGVKRRDDPDYIPIMVMNRIVGSTAASRLFMNLREEKGYTYGAYSFVKADVYRGVFGATTEVRNGVTDGSLHELFRELKRIQEERVPSEELDESQRSIVSSFALSLQQPQTLLDYWLTAKYYGFPMDYWDRYPAEVAKVTPAKIQEVANKYIDMDHLQIVCVGDGQQIRTILEKYAPVEVSDTDGKPATLGSATKKEESGNQ